MNYNFCKLISYFWICRLFPTTAAHSRSRDNEQMCSDDVSFYYTFFFLVPHRCAARIAFNTRLAGCKFTAHKWNKIAENNRRRGKKHTHRIKYKLFLKTSTQTPAVVSWKRDEINKTYSSCDDCDCVCAAQCQRLDEQKKQWNSYTPQSTHLPCSVFFFFLVFNVLFCEVRTIVRTTLSTAAAAAAGTSVTRD